MNRTLCLLLSLLFLSACGGSSSGGGQGAASSSSASVVPSLPGQVINDSIESVTTGIRYPLSIYLPLAASSSKPKLTVYALDGQWSFEGYAGIIENSGLPIMLVSIHQGPDNRRNVDYILPGAYNYFVFLNHELIPYIEQTYPAKSSRRMLAGTSGGGMFVDAAMLIDDSVNPRFNYLLSMDAPTIRITRSQLLGLERHRYNASNQLQVKLMLTGALVSADIGPFNDEVLEWYNYLLSREYQGLEVRHRAYNVNHYDIVAPSFLDALEYFYMPEDQSKREDTPE